MSPGKQRFLSQSRWGLRIEESHKGSEWVHDKSYFATVLDSFSPFFNFLQGSMPTSRRPAKTSGIILSLGYIDEFSAMVAVSTPGQTVSSPHFGKWYRPRGGGFGGMRSKVE